MREITTATKIGSRKQLTGLLLSALIQKGAGTELAKPLKKSKLGLGPQFYNLNCGGLQVGLPKKMKTQRRSGMEKPETLQEFLERIHLQVSKPTACLILMAYRRNYWEEWITVYC